MVKMGNKNVYKFQYHTKYPFHIREVGKSDFHENNFPQIYRLFYALEILIGAYLSLDSKGS